MNIGSICKPDTLRVSLISSYILSILSQICNLSFYLMIFKFLPLEQVGKFSWVMAIMVIVNALLDLGISPAMIRGFSQDNIPFDRVLAWSFLFRIPIVLVLIIALLLWITIKTPSIELIISVILAGFMFFIRTFTSVVISKLRAAEYQVLANSVTFSIALGWLLSGIILTIVLQKTEITYIFLSLFTVEVLVLVCSLITLKKLKIPISSSLLSIELAKSDFNIRLSKIGLVFGFITLFTALQNRLDWLLIKNFLKDADLARYSVANKWYETILVLIGPSLTAIFPRMCRGKNQKDYSLITFLKILTLWGGGLSLMGALIGPEILRVLWGQKYVDSEYIIRLFFLGAIISIFDSICYSSLIANGKEKFILVSTVIVTLIQTVANIFWIPRMGIMGATYGMLLLINLTSIAYGYVVCIHLKVLPLSLYFYSIILTLVGLLVLQTFNEIILRFTFGVISFCIISYIYQHSEIQKYFKKKDARR
ncbi:MAG: oligosaccharide flippase family protein [candidate division WOR-3 bacterium]